MLLVSCAHQAPVLQQVLSREPQVPSVELVHTPFFAQEEYQCGPAALAMVLKESGIDISPDELVSQVYIPARRGSLQAELVAAGRQYGRVSYVIKPNLSVLAAQLQAGRPVVVLQNLGMDVYPVWHYAVVIGYSLKDESIVLRSGTTPREMMSSKRFAQTWERSGNWGVVYLRPWELPANPDHDSYLKSVAAMEGVAPPDTVLSAYRTALTRWPDSTIAQFGLANALYALGRLQAAADTYQQLINEHPEHVAALNNLANVLADLGCYSRALATIETALATGPGIHTLREVLLQSLADVRKDQASKGHSTESCETPRTTESSHQSVNDNIRHDQLQREV